MSAADVTAASAATAAGNIDDAHFASVLADLGLARDADMHETEDHVAYLMEVMRYLIAGDDVSVCNLTRQSAFFSRHLQPWVSRLCQALTDHPRAAFYARLAALAEAFVSVESQGFDLL